MMTYKPSKLGQTDPFFWFVQGCICQIFTGGGVRVSTGYD